jgi:hypothetical protein
MLLLNLTLCCFQMCIPRNETQKCIQNDLYVLETVGGKETCLETHQAPRGEPWEMGCFTERTPRGGGRGRALWLARERKSSLFEFKVIWEAPAGGRWCIHFHSRGLLANQLRKTETAQRHKATIKAL